MSIITTLPGNQAVIGGPEDTIEGTNQAESIFGTDEDDVIEALGGGDFVQGFAGDDEINAGGGADTVLGGEGDDTIDGERGDDVLRGDAGNDTFVFDPSEQGDDTVVDFTEGDVVAFSSAGLAELGLEATSEALDEAEGFNLSEDPDTGDFVIEHAGGTITFNAVPFDEGPTTFAELEAAGLLEFTDEDIADGDDDGTDDDAADGDDDGTDDDDVADDDAAGDDETGDDEDEEESADAASSDSTDEAIA
jgi:RTX calcium-binding nonapeptide repeat (4 copies)